MLLTFLIFIGMSLSYAQEWCQFQDNLNFNSKATVLGIYGVRSDKEIKLAFEFKEPVILVLFNYGKVKWNIVGKNTKVLAIVTYGIYASEITGLPGTVPILENSHELGGPCTRKLSRAHLGPVSGGIYPTFHVMAQTRIKQLAIRLFPRKELRFYEFDNQGQVKRTRNF